LGGAKKAKADGNTVSLTANVTLSKTTLVVPEGVTLDLTKNRVSLTLGNNSTLTVNGTVNAARSGGLGIDPGTSTINGSGTINLLGKGTLISISSKDRKIRKLILDGVTLVGVKDNFDPLVFVIEGSELIMKSGKITGNNSNEGRGGGVFIYKSTFIMEGGEISGNTTKKGGGGVNIFIATFTMEGGEISGNTAGEAGGGVLVDEKSTFTMKSGKITGNGDCGVYVFEGTFTMEGGEISGNTSEAGGSGVLVGDRSRFTMSGGKITGNSSGAGGGVFVYNKSTFTMRDGEISGNSVSGAGVGIGGAGGGVYVHEGCTFTMEGGRIQGNKDSDGFIGNTSDRSSSFVLELDARGTAKWGTGGTYTKGGVSQTGGSNIASTNDTLIAIPAK
jgi:hypothetical protein